MTLDTSISTTCDLCSLPLSACPLREGDSQFCCHGCQSVYQILKVRGQLLEKADHPLFQEALKSGLISNPHLHLKAEKKQEDDQTLTFEIQGLWCPSCAEIIRYILLQEKGVKTVIVDYATDIASIQFSPRVLSKDDLFSRIRRLGYTPVAFDDLAHQKVSRDLWFRFGIAAFFNINIMMFSYPLYASYFHATEHGSLFAWLSFGASLPVLFYSGLPLLRRFWNALLVGVLGMEALVVIGVSSAFFLSCYNLSLGSTHVYFDSMTTIILFLLLGKIIESRAKFSAKESLFALSRSLPRRCRKRFLDGSERFIPMKELCLYDTVVALTGEKIPIDGLILEGEGLLDESMMTGESTPLFKKVGESVLAGSFLVQGQMAIQTTKELEATALSHILNMVGRDLENKTLYSQAVEPITRYFVPLVLFIAMLTLFFHSWLAAVAVLLISCPCAIGIAAPLAESELMRALASMGAIVRSRACLSLLGKEDHFVFDKTGTITCGKFTVLKGLDTLTSNERSILKGLASRSNHPASVAIYQNINEEAAKLTSHEEVIGKGVQGYYQNALYRLGSKTFTGQQGEGSVYFNEHPILLGDAIRPGASELIAQLKTKTLLLSGDDPLVVEQIAKKCRFDTWQGACLPLEKREVIRSLPGVVAMVGDGINDAPALTAADISISVISASDISIQVSDILLTSDRLEVIAKMRSMATRGRRILHQNLFWAFFYNVIGIGLAAFGLLTPIFAAAAMVISSLIVLFNSRRL